MLLISPESAEQSFDSFTRRVSFIFLLYLTHPSGETRVSTNMSHQYYERRDKCNWENNINGNPYLAVNVRQVIILQRQDGQPNMLWINHLTA